MNIDQFIKLLILQKDYHRSAKDREHAFVRYFNSFLLTEDITVEEARAPKLFPDQPDIPFVLFKPVIAYGEHRPLIIHTHGGPHVRFYKDTPHAEIMYFLKLGYVVACPNYRGSTNHPEQEPDYDIFSSYEKTTKFIHEHGPEDVYAVALHLQKQNYIDPHRITLRGGSIGSKINAHLLAGIKSKKFKSIFNGVHLAGGQEYPEPGTLPLDIPILLAHAVRDEMAAFAPAVEFMKGLQLRSFSKLDIFVSQFGDHHMINPNLSKDMTNSDEYREFSAYVELFTEFMRWVNTGLLTPEYIAKTKLPQEKKRQQMDSALVTRSLLLREFKRKKTTIDIVEKSSVLNPLWRYPSPSCMHIQTILGSQYIRHDLSANVRSMLTQCYPPTRSNLHLQELSVLTDGLVRMIQYEMHHHDHLYFYHGCNNMIAFAYSVYTALYRALNANDSWVTLRPDHEYLHRLLDIGAFIKEFECADNSVEVNNKSYYNDCVTATNVYAFGNFMRAKLFSLDYMVNNSVERSVDLAALLQNLLATFNLPREYADGLITLYHRYAQSKRGVFYQIAMHKDEVGKVAYPCKDFGRLATYHDSCNLAEIIDKIMCQQTLDSDTLEYVRTQQARVMMRPEVKFKIDAIRLPGSDWEQREDYQLDLTACINNLLLQIFNKYTPLQQLNRKTSMFSIMYSLFSTNQTLADEVRPDILLMRSLVTGHWDVVKQIFIKYPDLLVAELAMPPRYIQANDDYSDRPERISPSKWILSHPNQKSLGTLFECFPKKLVDDLIGQEVAKLNSYLLSKIPEDQRHHYLSYISTTEIHKENKLLTIMEIINYESRYPFIMQHAHSIKTVHILRRMLTCLFDKQRINLVLAAVNCITSASELSDLLQNLGNNEKLPAFQRYRKVIVKAGDLYGLKYLPAEVQEETANEYLHLLKSGDDLQYFIRLQQSDQDKMHFAKKYSHLIKLDLNLRWTLFSLPADQRLQFAIETHAQNNVSTENSFFCIMEALLPAERAAFIKHFNIKVSSVQILYFMLEKLELEDGKYLITSNQETIVTQHPRSVDSVSSTINYTFANLPVAYQNAIHEILAKSQPEVRMVK